MSLQSTLASVDRTPVEEREIKAFTNEQQHFSVAFDLFRECAAYVCVLASTTVGDKPTWNVGQAVLGGHLVRTYKLMCFVLEEAIERRAELLSIITRLLAEGVINLRYLVRNYSRELVESYLAYSLQHEKALAERIRGNVHERGGVELPIETRMLRSIHRTFENSLMSESALPAKKIRNWGDKNLFEKAEVVDLPHAYSAVFGSPSRNVHGGWQDMLQHHLVCVTPGEFKARLEFTRPRPQAVYALSRLIAETLLEYSHFLEHPAVEPVIERIEDLLLRNDQASELHEAYLVAKAGQKYVGPASHFTQKK